MARIGDVFSVELDNGNNKYFQFIVRDRLQLGSEVIRGFRKQYPIDSPIDLSGIVNDEIEFYAHCLINVGIRHGFWKKVGSVACLDNLSDVMFRDTDDIGTKVGEERIKVSEKWYVWKLDDAKTTRIGKLEGEYQNAYFGIVYNPKDIIKLMKGEKNPGNYPD